MTITKVNPSLFRNLKYMITVSPDIMSPRSKDLERALDLETFDRMVQSPVANQEEAYRLLLTTNPKTMKDPDKYVAEQPEAQPETEQAMPAAGNSPLAAMGKASPLSPQASGGAMAALGK